MNREPAAGSATPRRFRIEVVVVPRAGLLDPQGKAIEQALAALGHDCVEAVRHGKAMLLDVRADSAEAARAQVRAMCRKLLANPVTEDFEIRVHGEAAGSPPAGSETRAAGEARSEPRPSAEAGAPPARKARSEPRPSAEAGDPAAREAP